jgi:thiopeptide-type bacteriocin biosynthesis protein
VALRVARLGEQRTERRGAGVGDDPPRGIERGRELRAAIERARRGDLLLQREHPIARGPIRRERAVAQVGVVAARREVRQRARRTREPIELAIRDAIEQLDRGREVLAAPIEAREPLVVERGGARAAHVRRLARIEARRGERPGVAVEALRDLARGRGAARARGEDPIDHAGAHDRRPRGKGPARAGRAHRAGVGPDLGPGRGDHRRAGDHDRGGCHASAMAADRAPRPQPRRVAMRPHQVPGLVAPQVLGELARVAVARVDVARHRLADDRREIGGHARLDGRELVGRSGEQQVERDRGIAGGVRQPAGQQVVEDRAERIDVDPRVDQLPARLLRRHVGRGPDHRAAQRQARSAGQRQLVARSAGRIARGIGATGQPRQAPVDDRDLAELADQHVRRLEVAVDHAAAVRVGDRVGDRGDDREQRDALVEAAVVEPRVQRGPAEQLHDVERPAILVAPEVVDRHDRRVLEARHQVGLAHQASCRARGLERQLDRDDAVELAIERDDDPAAAAARELVAQLVAVPARCPGAGVIEPALVGGDRRAHRTAGRSTPRANAIGHRSVRRVGACHRLLDCLTGRDRANSVPGRSLPRVRLTARARGTAGLASAVLRLQWRRMAKVSKRGPAAFRPSGSFILRTPLLSRDEIDRWGEGLAVPGAGDSAENLARAIEADRTVLRERLRGIVARPEVREAIFVASPGLESSIDGWIADPTSESGQKTERSLVRYVLRMATRPTPFGLFAGSTVGALGETTQLELGPRDRYRRYTRIDGDYLSDLTDALVADKAVRARLVYRPNTSLCRVAGRLRYAMRREGASRSYSLVSLEPSDYLVATLERAQRGALPADLAIALCDADAEVTREEADDFINELIDGQVLVSDLAPPVTGPEAVDDIIAQLAEVSDVDTAGSAAAALRSIRATLGELDRAIGNSPERYRGAAESLAALPAKPEIARLFQVNLVPTAVRAELGSDVLDEIARAIDVLRKLARPRGTDELSRFRDAFVERYETRELPLAEVLDEESGIGFAASQAPAAAASPLLEGLMFPGAVAEETVPWGARAAFLARRIAAAVAAGNAELVLDDNDLAMMDAGTPGPTPDAFQAMIVLARTAEGELRIQISSAGGPPGATLLGRFCHSDRAMHDAVTANLAAEEALRPEVVFAEVVHLADGRLANISARPVLREHEIVYLGRSGAPHDRQIPITDLMVSVRGNRVVLRSRSLGKEIVPRLTNAHNYVNGALGPYRFLASLQGQDVRPLYFQLGPLAQLPYVPRIRIGRVILREASWTLRKAELEPVTGATGAARMQALHRLRAAARLPRWVCVEDADNVLPIDLDNVLAVDSFAQLVKQRTGVTLSELWPGPSELVVDGPDGRYANEIVVPYVRVPGSDARPAAGALRPGEVQRRFSPGSEWLYAKLYAGHATSDQILTEAIAPLVRDLPAWFFIRYGDPHWHVRFRVRGEPARLYGELMPRLAEHTRAMLDDGRMWRLQLDTYEREVERYGGPVGIELAERLFCADSACTIDILGMLSGDAGNDARWRLALRAIDQLFDDLGFDLALRLTVMRRTRDGFAQEHRVDSSVGFQRGLGDKYRKERVALEALLDRARDADSDLAPGLERLALRSTANAPIAADLRAAEQRGQLTMPLSDLAPSYIHMLVNRLIRSAQRAHEVVLYDLLVRLYESRVARAKKPRGAAPASEAAGA